MDVLVVVVVGTQKVAFGGDSTFVVDDVKVVPLTKMGNGGRYGICIGTFRPRQTLLA